MDALEEFKQTFFQECDELLGELESHLMALQDEATEVETLHAAFRAIHSIKGGAGAFGFDRLVSFSHIFETVLDLMREGKVELTEDIVATVVRAGAQFHCRLTDDAAVSGHRPSVDVLFESVIEAAGENAVGVILTGMGKDGAAGLLKMREFGASTMGQNEASCLVYGMPKAAAAVGAVMEELPLGRIAETIVDACREPKRKASA